MNINWKNVLQFVAVSVGVVSFAIVTGYLAYGAKSIIDKSFTRIAKSIDNSTVGIKESVDDSLNQVDDAVSRVKRKANYGINGVRKNIKESLQEISTSVAHEVGNVGDAVVEVLDTSKSRLDEGLLSCFKSKADKQPVKNNHHK